LAKAVGKKQLAKAVGKKQLTKALCKKLNFVFIFLFHVQVNLSFISKA